MGIHPEGRNPPGTLPLGSPAITGSLQPNDGGLLFDEIGLEHACGA